MCNFRNTAMTALWATTWEELGGDFTGMLDLPGLLRVALRLFVAALLGGMLGWQRACHGKAAGLRTHMIVAMGAAAFVLLPLQAGWSTADLSRVVQGVVAGIGFLGGGTIL